MADENHRKMCQLLTEVIVSVSHVADMVKELPQPEYAFMSRDDDQALLDLQHRLVRPLEIAGRLFKDLDCDNKIFPAKIEG